MISMGMTSDEFVARLCSAFPMPKYTPGELLVKYKAIIDKTPDKFLQFHLDNSIKNEDFELAAYIRDTIKTRGITPHNTP